MNNQQTFEVFELLPKRGRTAKNLEGLFYWIAEKPNEYRQLRVLRFSMGFLEPFVTKMVDQVETLRSKINPSQLTSKET